MSIPHQYPVIFCTGLFEDARAVGTDRIQCKSELRTNFAHDVPENEQAEVGFGATGCMVVSVGSG